MIKNLFLGIFNIKACSYISKQVTQLLTKSDTVLKEVVSVNFKPSDDGKTMGAIDVQVIIPESKSYQIFSFPKHFSLERE